MTQPTAEKTERRNGPRELMAAFSCPGREVKVAEFNEFWKSLDEGQKAYYRNVDIETGLVPA